MRRIWRAAVVGALVFAATAGCIVKDERHTWYLDPSGSLVWTVTEENIRSDARAEPDRMAEEARFWASVQAQDHDLARSLRELGGTNVRTRVIRSEPPYAIVTDAGFNNVAQMGTSLISLLELTGESRLDQGDGSLQWTFRVRDPHAEESPDDPVVIGLAEALMSVRVVLTRGRFEEAVGFELSSDRRVATIDEAHLDAVDDDLMLVLVLRWSLP